MAIALRNVTNVDQSAGATTIVITKPTGTVDGDVLLAFIEYNGNDTITPPSGWTLLDTAAGGATNQKTSSYVKLASGEPASWTWSIGTQIWEGSVSSWTGVDNVTKTEGDVGATGSTSTATASTLTPTSTDDVSVVGFTTVNSTALSLPTSYTNVASFGSNGDIVRIALLQLSSNAATGTTTSTETGTSQWTAQRVLLKTGVTVSSGAPLLRPATMQFRGSLGALLMGRIAARVFPAVINTGSIGALSGSAITTAVTSGAVTGTGAVVGATIAKATPTGTLTGTGAIAGATAARAVVVGAGTTLNPISGSTIATALTAGTVTGKAALVGAANASAIATGALAGKGALSGASVITVIANGATTGVGALSGQAISTAITTGTVSSAAANLAGAAVCTAIASGAVTGKGALSGQAVCSATVTGTFSVLASPISGAATCRAVESGAVTGSGALAGSTNVTATASGAITAKGALAGSSVVTVQSIGFVTNVPTPNISGSTICTVTASAVFTDAPPVSNIPPTGGGSHYRGAAKWWKDKPKEQQHVIGYGAFTLPGNSLSGRGNIRFQGKGAFDLPGFAYSGHAQQSFDGAGEFELDHMGLRVWAKAENKTYATVMPGLQMSAECTVSMDDREEEEIIIKLFYEN